MVTRVPALGFSSLNGIPTFLCQLVPLHSPQTHASLPGDTKASGSVTASLKALGQ